MTAKFDEGLGLVNSLGIVTLPLDPSARVDGIRLKIGALGSNYGARTLTTFDDVSVDVP